jgi:alcohol dehydrogenase YqhD (iron-dependent ADH family)
MQTFTLYNPTKLTVGRGVNSKIGTEIARRGFGKVLLIAGGGSIKKNGVYDTVISSLTEAGVSAVEKWGVRPNPVLSLVRDAITLARDENVDAILAVGGGSVVDTAKAVAAGLHSTDIWASFESYKLITKALPLFVVLTLSATGSEMNGHSVVTNEHEKKKWSISGPALYPVVSLIDPSVQIGLPWRQTVNGVIDAMSHVMEFYFMGSNEEPSLALDEMLLTTLIATGDHLMATPDDYDARSHLAYCATLALNGISGVALSGGDWASHGLEHGISALYPEVAHAEGLAVTFPAWIDYHRKNGTKPELLARFARKVWGKETIEEAIDAMRAKYTSWGAPTRLSDLGVSEADIPKLSDNVAMMGTIGQLKKLDRTAIEVVYRLAL